MFVVPSKGKRERVTVWAQNNQIASPVVLLVAVNMINFKRRFSS